MSPSQPYVYPYVIWGTNDGDGGPSWEDVIRGVQPDISMRFLVPDRHQLFFVFVQGNSDRRNPIGHFICADYRYHNLQTNLNRIYDSYDFYQWRYQPHSTCQSFAMWQLCCLALPGLFDPRSFSL